MAFLNAQERECLEGGWLRWILVAVVGIALGLAFDVLAMNYQAVESAFFEPVASDLYEVEGGNPDGSISSGHPVSLKFSDGASVKGLSVSFSRIDGSSFSGKVNASVLASDEGSSILHELGSTRVKLDKEAYFRIHPSGQLREIRIAVGNVDASGEIAVDVQINPRAPFKPNPFLWMAGAVIAFVAFALRPSSRAWQIDMKDAKALITIIGVLLLVVFALTSIAEAHGLRLEAASQQKYDKLAEAFLDGHVYLSERPSDELLALSNPYDIEEREQAGVKSLWDYALYDGKYYVYFGVLPCVLMFLPFRAITGMDLPVTAATLAMMPFLILGVLFFAYRLCARFFPRMSLGHFIVVLATVMIGGGATFFATVPDSYTLPIAMGLALELFGLGLWLDATSSKVISTGKAVAGSALLAATVLCRPQMLAGGIVVIALLAYRAKRFGVASIGKPLVLSALVVLLIFSLQGGYNYARFGSVFDFGATYNLTSNDMRVRGFEVDRLPLALIAYLFQPPMLQADAPFFSPWMPESDYYGTIIAEQFLGGLFCMVPLLFSLGVVGMRRYRRSMDGEIKLLITTLLLVGFAVMVFDANGAGMLPRYFMDFGLYFSFGAALCIGTAWGERQLVERDSADGGKWQFTPAGAVLSVLTVVSVILQVPSFALLG